MQAQAKAISATHPMTTHKVVFVSLLAISIYMLIISPALAQGITGTPTPMGIVLCNIVKFVYGNLGRGLATLAIMVVGVGATLGKVSWGLAITVGVGISVVFNANSIMTLLLTGSGASQSGCA